MRLLNYYIKAIDHMQVSMGYATWDVGSTLEEFVNHEPQASGLRILRVFYQHPA